MCALKSGCTTTGQCGFSSDAQADVWDRPVKQIQSFGSKVIFQIADGGVAGDPAVIDAVLRGAFSYRPDTRTMSITEIEEIVQAFADAARRVVRIGGDELMIHCADGYGISQFLSPFSNRRTDRDGGSLENRARVAVEIVREIKKGVPARLQD
jgi:2,4-dienoyl-CoA reductase-like NADH-dependent reductase (Old Yellow Enzyme family)